MRGLQFLFALGCLALPIVSAANAEIIIPKGKFKGQVADTEWGKNIKILSESSIQYTVKDIFFDSHYRSAFIPRRPAKVSLVVSDTDSQYKHVALAFDFHTPVELYRHGKRRLLRRLIFDGIAVGARGQEWKLMDAATGNYILMMRLTSEQDYREETGGVDAKLSCFHEIALSPMQMEATLRRALYASHTNPLGNMFRPMRNNCANVASQSLAVKEPGFFTAPEFFKDPVAWYSEHLDFKSRSCY